MQTPQITRIHYNSLKDSFSNKEKVSKDDVWRAQGRIHRNDSA